MIEVKNLTKKFGGFLAIDDLSFTVEDNQIVGLLGPNGAGKSTTMNLITGLIAPTKGKILVDGIDVDKYPVKIKEKIGYMPENIPLYGNLTVREFLTFMAELRKVPKDEISKRMEKLIDDLNLGKVQRRLIKNLSKGYKQRISLAGTLIGNPKIIILDEPMVGLDPEKISDMRDLIISLKKDHTIIFSSHILSEVSQICDKLIIINDGKLVKEDTAEKIEKSENKNDSIYISVQDDESKINNLKKSIKAIKEINHIKDNADGTKSYEIEIEKDANIQKELMRELTNNGIVLFELKNDKEDLEKAFIKIIKDSKQKNKIESKAQEKPKKKGGKK